MGWSEIIQTEHGPVRVCSRGGRRPRTWQCECGHKNPLHEKVCQGKKCGLYRDGCPLCDSDLVPAKDEVWGVVLPFKRGVKRLHICSGNKRENKLPCGYEVMA